MWLSRTKLLACAALPALLSVSPAAAAELWIEGGGALCTAPLNQTAPRLITNGLDGFLAVWRDDRDMGSAFIQNISRGGLSLWQPDGVSPCPLPTEETGPVFVADNGGGAIVAWVDARSIGGQTDIYAQRIRSDGTMAWQPNGVPVCRAAGDQWSLSICGDGSGGAIIAWWDDRAGLYELYAQRVDASGVIRWRTDGVEVCGVADFNPGFLRPVAEAVPDDAGGVILAWEDCRASDIAGDIYAQRLDSLGSSLWREEGVAVCDAASGQWSPAVVPDGGHGAIVAWHDFRGGTFSDIYAQRVNGNGELAWSAAGVPVCADGDDQFEPEAASDGEGGAIVAWIDLRSGTSFDVYAQRLNAAGDVMWGIGGVPLCAEPHWQADPVIVPDGAGGAIAAWHSFRGAHETDIWANRVSAGGVVMWRADGVPVCAIDGIQRHVAAAPDGEGGAFLAWEDARSLVGWDIYAQRICANGEPLSTLLQSYTAGVRGKSVVLQWTLTSPLTENSFEIMRSDAEGTRRFVHLSGVVQEEGTTCSFRDGGVEAGRAYVYRALARVDGESVLLFETGQIRVPAAALALEQNYPNPFRATTAIGYDVPSSMMIDLSVFSCRGDLVAHLYRGMAGPGRHAAAWDGKRQNGEPAVPGVYYCTLKGDHGRATKKIVLVR